MKNASNSNRADASKLDTSGEKQGHRSNYSTKNDTGDPR